MGQTSSLTGPSGISSVTTNKSRNCRKPLYGIWVWKAQGPGGNQFQVRQREKENFLAKSFITSGSQKCSDANNEKYKRNNLYFSLTYNMSLKRLKIYIWFGFMIS